MVDLEAGDDEELEHLHREFAALRHRKRGTLPVNHPGDKDGGSEIDVTVT